MKKKHLARLGRKFKHGRTQAHGSATYTRKIRMNHPNAHDIGTEAMKLAPPAFVSSTSIFFGFNWSDAAYALTAAYTFLMITQHIWEKWIKPYRAKRSD